MIKLDYKAPCKSIYSNTPNKNQVYVYSFDFETEFIGLKELQRLVIQFIQL